MTLQGRALEHEPLALLAIRLLVIIRSLFAFHPYLLVLNLGWLFSRRFILSLWKCDTQLQSQHSGCCELRVLLDLFEDTLGGLFLELLTQGLH